MAYKKGKDRDEIEVSFVNVELTAQQDEQFEEWSMQHVKDYIDLVGKLAVDGWKSSISWSDHRQAFVAAATCWNDRSKNAGVCLTSFSDDWVEALMLNVYKIRVIFEDGKIVVEKKAGKRRG